MKIECIKLAGGILAPVNDDESEKMKRFMNVDKYHEVKNES